ncbi:MAG: hypothetical protein EHM58_19935 [Ignavibacteriae bacterium]|nr:MAG: hypothetical protein EHM58_19935 [Ignavibacteriota bacterium]
MKDLSKVSGNSEITNIFPELPYEAWKDTYSTLHRWMQIAGKIKLELMPMQNHWWQVSLYITSAGLTTAPIPYGKNVFEIIFDFINHELVILLNNGKKVSFHLYPRSVSDFYNELMFHLSSLGLQVNIWTTPVETENRIPFEKDNEHSSYDPEYVRKFWLILIQADRIFKIFRSKFSGKTSPVNFFWGSFDLALSIYSGRPAPEYNGKVPNVSSNVIKESMSMEEYACGFWPGEGIGEPAFYAYAYPAPDGYKEYNIKPEGAYFNKTLGEFLLPYDIVRNSPDPDRAALEFLWTTYEAAAIEGNWDRKAIEYKPAFRKVKI